MGILFFGGFFHEFFFRLLSRRLFGLCLFLSQCLHAVDMEVGRIGLAQGDDDHHHHSSKSNTLRNSHH